MREFQCIKCGLLYCEEPFKKEGYYFTYECPNCPPNTSLVLACDGIGHAMHSSELKEITWSSEKFAPRDVIEIYRSRGIEIR